MDALRVVFGVFFASYLPPILKTKNEVPQKVGNINILQLLTDGVEEALLKANLMSRTIITTNFFSSSDCRMNTSLFA